MQASPTPKQGTALRPTTNDLLEHLLYPAFFGLAFAPSGVSQLSVCLEWSCRGTPYRAEAEAASSNLLPLSAAAGQAWAEARDCQWRFSGQSDSENAPGIFFSNASSNVDSLFTGVRVTIRFSSPPPDYQAANCQVQWSDDQTAILTLWDVVGLCAGAAYEQPLLPLDALCRSSLLFLQAVLQLMEEEHGRNGSGFDEMVLAFSEGLRFLFAGGCRMEAFRLTCETLRRMTDREPVSSHNRWRLFQLVFLVSYLPILAGEGAVSSADDELPVVYFPTGRGKTESFLGALVFLAFVQRFNGKTGGISSWTRFPLRLLGDSLLETMVRMISTAELVRLSEPSLNRVSSTQIALGVLEGGDVSKVGGARPLVWRCPACLKPATAEFDRERASVVHRCSQSACPFPGGVLPLYSGLRAIARFLPTAVLGTVDASDPIGEDDLQMVLGNAAFRCPTHGYSRVDCSIEGCAACLSALKAGELSRPSMFIPDHRRPIPVRTRGSLAYGHSV